MNVVIIDNYDSFTFNLFHYVQPWVDEVVVFRNNEFDLDDLEKYDGIIISPGPGLPKEAGNTMKVIDRYHKHKPIFGVCLGHQAIGEYFGAALENLPQVLHGRPSECQLIKVHDLFEGCGSDFLIGHYHSWVISRKDFPSSELTITAVDVDQNIMAIRHDRYPIEGVQFHPESILTPNGKMMMENWVKKLGTNFGKVE
ncbi:MAG: aminodeoxychorismate/anthranilate synthase component II [Flavobacteriales bacterium]|nr:aminodeoxychorismate/anthranilate synthase component II [Flavobacteriales bacterium]